tara:strand:+ start:174 stop:344 length:171 start_codon:yes stop_codon:yes gene_type:complete
MREEKSTIYDCKLKESKRFLGMRRRELRAILNRVVGKEISQRKIRKLRKILYTLKS